MGEVIGEEQLVGIDQVAEIIGDATVEELGIEASSPTVTHHDVRRAARLAAKRALELYDENPPISRGEH